MVPSSPASLTELYARCVQMANENKISAKNAFDLHLIDHMDAIVKSFLAGGGEPKSGGASSSSGGRGRMLVDSQTAEGGFHEVSCTIEASARIYGCRVDHVHINTYRVLGGLGGRAAGEEEEEEGGDAELEPNSKRRRIVGVNTLERNEANITQRFGEVDGQCDPVFLNMAAAFDAGGARGLLLATLPVAEDLSLVFNGDVPLSRAAEVAEPMFEHAAEAPVERLGLGEPAAAQADLAAARLCPLDLDGARRELWGGGAGGDVALTAELEALLQPRTFAAPRPGASPDRWPAGSGRGAPALLAVADRPPGAGGGAPDLELDVAVAQFEFDAAPDPLELDSAAPAEDEPGREPPQLPLVCAGGSEDVVPFDELLQTFCAGSGPHQFADFDRSWAKLPSESWARRAKEGEQCVLALADVERTPEKKERRREVEEEEKKKPPAKRSIFDLDDLDAPVEPLELEPVHKHQLGDEAALEQLHRDVPPYMIDNITLPTWRPSTYDFACLGLRPHLMLKLRRREPPEGEGPHSFFDLFCAEIAENPEAPAWLTGADAERAGEGAEHEDGLDAPLDLDAADSQDPLGMHGLDFDLAEHSQPARSADLPYSRSALFVDVRLVKKHLWDCISEDDVAAKALPEPTQAVSSFQGLVDRAVERLPEAATENLSAAVCFICALHLCNERGLELETDESRPLGDFNVVGPPRGGGGLGD